MSLVVMLSCNKMCSCKLNRAAKPCRVVVKKVENLDIAIALRKRKRLKNTWIKWMKVKMNYPHYYGARKLIFTESFQQSYSRVSRYKNNVQPHFSSFVQLSPHSWLPDPTFTFDTLHFLFIEPHLVCTQMSASKSIVMPPENIVDDVVAWWMWT